MSRVAGQALRQQIAPLTHEPLAGEATFVWFQDAPLVNNTFKITEIISGEGAIALTVKLLGAWN